MLVPLLRMSFPNVHMVSIPSTLRAFPSVGLIKTEEHVSFVIITPNEKLLSQVWSKLPSELLRRQRQKALGYTTEGVN